ncbi:unnamed protein product, partial [Discosporangium mesarthrocarpum]
MKVGWLGVVLNGFVLGGWYRVLDMTLGTDRRNTKKVLIKCAADQFVYAPIAITSFLSFAPVARGSGNVSDWGREAAKNLRLSFLDVWVMDWKVWPAVNLVAFRFLPSPYRPSFVSVAQVSWQTYMSTVGHNSNSSNSSGGSSP